MKFGLISAAALLLAIVGTPALAQSSDKRASETPLGTRIPRWEKKSLVAETQAVEIMRRFARCTIKTRRKASVAILSTLPNSKEEAKWVGPLIGLKGSSCLTAAKMTVNSALLRGTIAEVLLDEPEHGGRVLSVARPQQGFDTFTRPLTAVYQDGMDAGDRAVLVGRWVAYCSAHEDPARVRLLLASKPASRDELAALRDMGDLFSKCLLQGQKLELEALSMRALLAEAIYNRLVGNWGGA
jgi:hypothetical protein